MRGPPSDWPRPGPIDLALHDLPHRSSSTEWWYANAHLRAGGRRISIFAAFFRVLAGRDPKTGENRYTHSATWAVTDVERKHYHGHSRLDRSAPRMGLERIKGGRGSRDGRVNRAMAEVLERGAMPSPDRFFESEVRVSEEKLELDFGGLRYERLDDGSYRLSLTDAHTKSAAELVFAPRKPAVRHGDDGLVRGPGGEDMFYYFIPRCAVTGTITLEGAAHAVESGDGWLDHEFGAVTATPTVTDAKPAAEGPREDVAWNWIAAQLADGSELTAYSLVRCRDQKPLDQRAVLIDAQGNATTHAEIELVPDRTWRSLRTFFDYPTRWTLSVPAADLKLSLQASFEDQELVTTLSKPAFWEGRCEVSGTVKGSPVAGLAYLERSGFEPVKDLDEFFSAVGHEVRKSVARMAPLEPTPSDAQKLIGSDDRPHFLEGVHLPQLSRALIAPLRSITDRGGKSWRSYAALACCDVVGGDSRKFAAWLAMPELMHVGSLIVDDVQDKSAVRRGGPACHLIYGEALAINAGTAAYFMSQSMLAQAEVTGPRKLKLYDLYFEAMRAGHAGQALDLDGLADLMPAAVESGDSGPLELRILATHRLKTAAPAAALARMGAVAGGGSEAQIEAVGNFFEALGLAFQIVDDVLNLRGFTGDLKTRAEDIQNGLVTLPVAKALARLPADQRAWLWRTLKDKPSDARVLSAVVEELESCGAIEACVVQARELVESAWTAAGPLLDDSLSKVMLRSFGWYVLERHY